MDINLIHEVMHDNLDLYDRAIDGIKQCLSAYEKICSELIIEIANCASIDDANEKFDVLMEIQLILSKVLFGRKIEIGDKLETLTREFDRLDHPQTREYWHNKFREGITWPYR